MEREKLCSNCKQFGGTCQLEPYSPSELLVASRTQQALPEDDPAKCPNMDTLLNKAQSDTRPQLPYMNSQADLRTEDALARLRVIDKGLPSAEEVDALIIRNRS